MKDALSDGKRVEAGANAPKRAVCPECGAEVNLRHRRDTGAYFYRHKRRQGMECPRRAQWQLSWGPPLQCQTAQREMAVAE